jgi:hypothetical protein
MRRPVSSVKLRPGVRERYKGDVIVAEDLACIRP